MQKISFVKKIYFQARLLINYLSSMEMFAICGGTYVWRNTVQ